jgi:hypothetical protein
MADNYTLVKTLDEPLVLSATQVEDGTTVGFVTHPHEVYVEATLPKSQVTSIGYGSVAEPLAFNVERLLTDGTAESASFTQTVDASGLLGGAVAFVVAVAGKDTFAGGSLTETVTLSIRQLFLLSDNLHLFDEARQRLIAASGL